MSTSAWFKDFLADCLSHIPWISFRKMFGEYAIYKDGVTIGLLCDDTVFFKVHPVSTELLGESQETWAPYPWAKPWYVIPEEIYSDRDRIAGLVNALGNAIEKKEKKPKKKKD